MRIVNAKIGSPIHIGRQGENLATKVVFNIDDWINTYGDSDNIELVANIDEQIIIIDVTKNGNEVVWEVKNDITQFTGHHICELFYTVNSALVKSRIYNFVVDQAIDSTEGTEPPEYANTWVTEVIDAKKEAIDAKKVAVEAKDAAEAAQLAASGSASEAAQSASNAASSEQTANSAATNANNSAILAKQWAIGNADTELPEYEDPSDTNNSRYYALQAKESETNAASSAGAAAGSAQTASDKANAAAQSVIDANQIKTDVTSIQKDITTKHGEINTKHKEVVEKHSEVVTKHQDVVTKHQDVASKHQEVKTLHSEVKTLHGEVKSNATQVSTAWANIKEVQVPHINEQVEKVDEWTKEASQDAESAAKSADAAEKSAEITSHPPYMNQDSGNWLVYNGDTNQYEDTGVRYSLSIIKSYSSVVSMEADLSNMREGDLVIIASNVGDEDNSKLYVHAGSAWKYLSDLSGLEGIGIASVTKTSGTGQPGTKDTYTVTLTDGRVATTIDIYQGKDGEGVGDMKAENYDPTGAVYAADGIENYIKNNTTRITMKTWTAADI